jgi:hypothetical protein
MQRIDIKQFGLAVGATLALLYLGCALVMALVGRDAAIVFFNSLLHGVDVTSIIRMDLPLWEAAVGVVETFILGWLSGATVAAIYNFAARAKIRDSEKETV